MSASATLSKDDAARLTRAIEQIGTADFPKLFCQFCAGLTEAESIYLSAFFDGARPVEIYSSHTSAETTEALETYLDIAFVLDPFFQLFLEKSGDSVDDLKSIAPDDFRRSEYYAKFFKVMKLADECGVMLHLSDEAALFLSLGVTGKNRLQIDRLRALLGPIGALARRHWTVLTPERFDGTGRLAAHLEQAFENFGSSVLSPREGEITRMILQGHSSKAIARTFDNSPETIKVHRKRIYTKLGVSSQGELLSLFLNALRHLPATGQGDPLEYLADKADTGPISAAR